VNLDIQESFWIAIFKLLRFNSVQILNEFDEEILLGPMHIDKLTRSSYNMGLFTFKECKQKYI